MKINTSCKPYNLSKQKPLDRQAFKGYFACPIKELHFEAFNTIDRRYPIIKELNEKCGKYFKILIQTVDGFTDADKIQKTTPTISKISKNSYHEYGQDNKLFTENGILLLEGCDEDAWKEGKILANHLKLKTKQIKEYIQGGNCFLGKKENGENFALLGKDALAVREKPIWREKIYPVNKNVVAEALGIKPENIYVIPQPDFHLDMAIRPLKYPYVLVDDMDLTIAMAKTEKQRAYVNDKYYTYSQKEMIDQRGYTTPMQTADNLSKLGFKPIMVPGSLGFYRRCVNYLNAIVHQNPDGSLVYITNHSKSGRSFWDGFNMEKMFSKYVKEKCPDIKEVIFIDGKGMIASSLNRSNAGIHCLASERPDFKNGRPRCLNLTILVYKFVGK